MNSCITRTHTQKDTAAVLRGLKVTLLKPSPMEHRRLMEICVICFTISCWRRPVDPSVQPLIIFFSDCGGKKNMFLIISIGD